MEEHGKDMEQAEEHGKDMEAMEQRALRDRQLARLTEALMEPEELDSSTMEYYDYSDPEELLEDAQKRFDDALKEGNMKKAILASLKVAEMKEAVERQNAMDEEEEDDGIQEIHGSKEKDDGDKEEEDDGEAMEAYTMIDNGIIRIRLVMVYKGKMEPKLRKECMVRITGEDMDMDPSEAYDLIHQYKEEMENNECPTLHAIVDAEDALNLLFGAWAPDDDALIAILRDNNRRRFIVYDRLPFWSNFDLLSKYPQRTAIELGTIRAYQLSMNEHHEDAIQLCERLFNKMSLHPVIAAIRLRSINELAIALADIKFNYALDRYVDIPSDFDMDEYERRADKADAILANPQRIFTRPNSVVDSVSQWGSTEDVTGKCYRKKD